METETLLSEPELTLLRVGIARRLNAALKGSPIVAYEYASEGRTNPPFIIVRPQSAVGTGMGGSRHLGHQMELVVVIGKPGETESWERLADQLLDPEHDWSIAKALSPPDNDADDAVASVAVMGYRDWGAPEEVNGTVYRTVRIPMNVLARRVP